MIVLIFLIEIVWIALNIIKVHECFWRAQLKTQIDLLNTVLCENRAIQTFVNIPLRARRKSGQQVRPGKAHTWKRGPSAFSDPLFRHMRKITCGGPSPGDGIHSSGDFLSSENSRRLSCEPFPIFPRNFWIFPGLVVFPRPGLRLGAESASFVRLFLSLRESVFCWFPPS